MRRPLRWENCLDLRGSDVEQFATLHFGDSTRHVLVVAGAGFDPRATLVTQLLAKVATGPLDAIFVREHRPSPSPELLRRAEANALSLGQTIASNQPIHVEIFASDGALVAGRRMAQALESVCLDGVSDIVVDWSALSMGVAFPLVRYLLETPRRDPSTNIHLMVVHAPDTDGAIRAIASDRADPVAGFRGDLATDERSHAARLWLPHLVEGKAAVLNRIHSYVKPHETCPVLPFPSARWRLGDKLLAEYRDELEGAWDVDARNIVFAAENSPLDLYRTIHRIAQARASVFDGVGGSLTVLSPIGSKLLSMGAFMAAFERDYPVVYVEAAGYVVDLPLLDSRDSEGELVHLWLSGETDAVAEQGSWA
jgi:hypothetical protein